MKHIARVTYKVGRTEHITSNNKTKFFCSPKKILTPTRSLSRITAMATEPLKENVCHSSDNAAPLEDVTTAQYTVAVTSVQAMPPRTGIPLQAAAAVVVGLALAGVVVQRLGLRWLGSKKSNTAKRHESTRPTPRSETAALPRTEAELDNTVRALALEAIGSRVAAEERELKRHVALLGGLALGRSGVVTWSKAGAGSLTFSAGSSWRKAMPSGTPLELILMQLRYADFLEGSLARGAMTKPEKKYLKPKDLVFQP